jgi:hypothetical protein
MATVTKDKIRELVAFGGAPYGNATSLLFSLITNASGVLLNGDKATALVQTDKVRLGIMPAGTLLKDALAITSDAFTASVTHKIGFEYVDGEDSADVPQDDDYFYAALAGTVGRTRASNTGVRPVVLPKEAYLIATVGGADHASAGVLDLVVDVELKGAP